MMSRGQVGIVTDVAPRDVFAEHRIGPAMQDERFFRTREALQAGQIERGEGSMPGIV